MRDRKKRNITIISLCCLLVFMAVGYAVLSQTLNIDGTANLTVYLGDSDFAYNGGFDGGVTNVTIGEGITGFNIPEGTQKLVVPSTIQSISDIKGLQKKSC